MTRRDRFLAMLPIATEHGVITGSLPEEWQIRHPGREEYCIYPYSPCCQDPRNWRGEGESRPLRSPPIRSCPDATEYRDRVVCAVCGVEVIAGEYVRGHVE